MSHEKISVDKHYETREGLPYRCYATDGGGSFPVHGAFFRSGEWFPVRHTEHGGILLKGEHAYDLIEVKPRMKFERWIVVEDDGSCKMWGEKKPSSEAVSDAFAIKHFVFEVEKGEGL